MVVSQNGCGTARQFCAAVWPDPRHRGLYDGTRLCYPIEMNPGVLYHTGRRFGCEIFDLVCPRGCAACGHELAGDQDELCESCWGKLRHDLQAEACPTCGHRIGAYSLIHGRCHRCQQRRWTVSQIARVGEYGGVLRELILRYKFSRFGRLDRFLGELLASAVIRRIPLENLDGFVPVPLHWRRTWKRGFNQADLLARQTALVLKRQGKRIPVLADLVRVRYTAAQGTLTWTARHRNLRGAFAVRPDVDLKGRHLCLIDDVSTSGHTLGVAAYALKRAGASRISAAVLAVSSRDQVR